MYEKEWSYGDSNLYEEESYVVPKISTKCNDLTDMLHFTMMTQCLFIADNKLDLVHVSKHIVTIITSDLMV